MSWQHAPTYGPVAGPPKISDGHPLWWFPTSGALATSGLELWLHATHPVASTFVFGGITGLSAVVSALTARYGGGMDALGALVASAASGLAAWGCAIGGSMVAATAVFGSLGGVGWLVPEWLFLHREQRKAIAEIEKRRMDHQYAWEARQQALAAKGLDVQAAAYGVMRTDVTLQGVLDGLAALTDRLDGIPVGHRTVRGELAAGDDLTRLLDGLFRTDNDTTTEAER